MSLVQALNEIRSHEFAARLNVVSGPRFFFTAVGKEPVVVSLLKDMGGSGEAREEVFGLITDLSQLKIDRRYENPYDTALAVLLWLTLYAAPDLSRLAAEQVYGAPQCWYAKKLAHRVLEPPRVASGNDWVGAYRRDLQTPGGSSSHSIITVNLVSKEMKRVYEHASTATPTGGGSVVPAQEG